MPQPENEASAAAPVAPAALPALKPTLPAKDESRYIGRLR
jgi:hypothetical protein